jgi:hypothetical protein
MNSPLFLCAAVKCESMSTSVSAASSLSLNVTAACSLPRGSKLLGSCRCTCRLNEQGLVRRSLSLPDGIPMASAEHWLLN